MPAAGLTRGALRGSTPGSGPVRFAAEQCCWGRDGGCLRHPASRKPAVVWTQPPGSRRKNHVSSAGGQQQTGWGGFSGAWWWWWDPAGFAALLFQAGECRECRRGRGGGGGMSPAAGPRALPQESSPLSPCDITHWDEGQWPCHLCPPRLYGQQRSCSSGSFPEEISKQGAGCSSQTLPSLSIEKPH